MQTETLEKTDAQVTPINETAELIDREIHRKTLEQINVLAREYEIRNPSEVAEFLSENKSLIDLLEEIPAQIRKVFGKKQNLTLEFFLDPEDSTWHRLFVRVPTKSEVEVAHKSFDNFKENWWFENEERSNSKIFINLRFTK
ncbi:MAG TPA: hypothetical protein PKE69_23705 [Pyrinomonadaceae bacterium]|nr:hypothetical protein [Pyrinomonadaceae bacterium]